MFIIYYLVVLLFISISRICFLDLYVLFLITYSSIHVKIILLEGDYMKIYSGLEYSYKIKEMIVESIEKTKANPLLQYTFIIDHPEFLEEAFLKYTDTLFSIEIMTLEALFQKQLNAIHSPAKKISKIEKTVLLKEIVSTNSSLFSNTPIYPMIEELLKIFDEFALLNDIESIKATNSLSKEKIETCLLLYKQFSKSLPPHMYLSLVEPLLTKTLPSNTHYIFITEKILHPKILTYLKKLDSNNTITILLHTTKEATLHDLHTQYFSIDTMIEQTSKTPLLDSLCNTIYHNKTIPYPGDTPFYQVVETTPLHEIQTIVLDIYQQIVDKKARYQDFAIYYPNTQYQEIINDVLTRFSMPYNNTKETIYPGTIKACTYFLQYLFTKQEEDFLFMLDTLCLKACTTFIQVNSYKKRWQELHSINHDSYLSYKVHIDTTYLPLLQKATTYHDFSVLLKTFIEAELVFNEACTTLTSYLLSFENCTQSTSLQDFIDFVEYTKPSFTSIHKPILDHIYVFNLQQPYAGILPIKKIYIVGMNETIVPPTFKDEGILLNIERMQIDNMYTINHQLLLAKNTILKILSANTEVVFSYALASATGETLLPSSLFLQLQQVYTIQGLETLDKSVHPALSEYLYSEGNRNKELKIDAIIEQYKYTKNQPLPLTLPLSIEQLSASQLETYNGCPYKYFYQYQIGIQPFSQYILQSNEIGTLVHYLLEINSYLFSSKEATANTIDTQTITRQIQEYVSANESISKKIMHPVNQYFISCLTKDIYTTICILQNQMKVSLFTLTNTEERISREYLGFKMKGFVDRIDTFRNYLKVIDYKSSDKDLDLNLAMQGFNMQMLIYIDMLSKNKQLDKGALLYFNTKKRILKSKDSILADISEEEFFKLYRMNGYVHEDVIEEIDNQIEGSSSIIKVRYVKSKDKYSGNILNTTSFTTLVTKIEEHIQELYSHMLQQDIRILPKGSYDPTTFTKVNPCSYCPYTSLCGFDVFYNEYSLVDTLDVDSILGGEHNE